VERLNSWRLEGISKAKAIFWVEPDTEMRKRGEQTGLDTLVVHAVNDADSFLDDKKKVSQHTFVEI